MRFYYYFEFKKFLTQIIIKLNQYIIFRIEILYESLILKVS